MDRIRHLQLGEPLTVHEEILDLPVRLTVYHDEQALASSGRLSPFVLLYIVGAAIERLGQRSDGDLVGSMLARGYTVIVLDYLGASTARVPALDRSVQRLRNRIEDGEVLSVERFPRGECFDTLVVPAGCDVLTDHVFWSFDRHGADGTLDKIVEVWNNDFRGVKGEILIPWIDAKGKRKPTATAFDGSEPIWYDVSGKPDGNGEYLLIKHTLARSISDCTRQDGSPLQLDLAMHIVYPCESTVDVPVMCLPNSSAHLTKCAATPDRPHLVGFAFRGYATVSFDYGYTPMARADHYGYFDGNRARGHVTGDNTTYSMQFYNDKLIQTAALRCVRYLALSDRRFCFDTDRIGVIGNSKGGWTAFLGEEHPERIPPVRMFPGHHGETRYENRDTETKGGIRGGEEQPWLTFHGASISSGANFVYSGCGGTVENMTVGHAPTFISCNRNDNWNSYYSTSNRLVAICRTNDIRALWLDVPIGHTLVYGTDCLHGIDSYSAFFDFADFYLKRAPIRLLWSECRDGAVTLQFSGDLAEQEVKKLRLTSSDGRELSYTYRAYFGGTQWSIEPIGQTVGEINLTLPDTLVGANGSMIGKALSLVLQMSGSRPSPQAGREEKYTRQLPVTRLTHGECVTARTDGDVLTIETARLICESPYQEYYHNPHMLFTCSDVLDTGALSEADIGRRFRISFEVCDSSSRYLEVYLNSATSREHGTVDYRYSIYHLVTEPNIWRRISFDYTVYEPEHGEVGFAAKTLFVSGFCRGDLPEPISFRHLTVTELI